MENCIYQNTMDSRNSIEITMVTEWKGEGYDVEYTCDTIDVELKQDIVQELGEPKEHTYVLTKETSQGHGTVTFP